MLRSRSAPPRHAVRAERPRPPFNKLLRFELEQRPLDGDVWATGSLLQRLEKIVATGDLAEQQRLFRDVEALARAHGLGDVIDGWEPDVPRLRGES